MKKSALNYILLITFFTLSSCASKNYEWVKINPDRIAKAKTSKPYSENIKYVDILVNAKYKAENVVYVENSAAYFTSQNSSSVKPNNRRIINKRTLLANNTAKVTGQPASKPKSINIKSQRAPEEGAAAMNKLNGGLILPEKKMPLAEDKPLFEDVAPVKETHAQIEKEAVPLNTKTDENLSYDNGLGQLEDQDIELSSRQLNDSSLEPLSENQIKEGAKRNSYMWVGLVLLIIGLIIGLIFGGLAYFISVIGIVFLLIGYLTKT